MKSVVAAGVGLAICALAASASAQRGDILGEWKTGGCTLTLTDKDWFGDWRAISFACQGDLFHVDRYRIEGDTLVLVGMGAPKARLRMRGDQLVGKDIGGRDLTLTRKGAAPVLAPRGNGGGRPSGGWDSGNNYGGWDDGGCIKYGDSNRCATQVEMGPPQVQTVVRANLRSSASLDSSIVQKLEKGTCVALQECRQQGDQLWCKVQADGATGYLVQISPSSQNPREKLLVFKNGCRD
ncbi:MAG: SH3 domain-containing protein [Caulobacter sp.]|nr:SH3 domain-containing protein [Caulobacter sp.]